METRREALRLREAMTEDHARLENLVCDVMDALRADDREAVFTLWLALETALTSHFEFEERIMLPSFAVGFPFEAEQIRQEHKEILEALEQVGSELDRDDLWVVSARQLLARLRKHAAREDTLFYLWAEAHVADDDRHSFARRFREWFAQAARLPPALKEVPAQCRRQAASLRARLNANTEQTSRRPIPSRGSLAVTTPIRRQPVESTSAWAAVRTGTSPGDRT